MSALPYVCLGVFAYFILLFVIVCAIFVCDPVQSYCICVIYARTNLFNIAISCCSTGAEAANTSAIPAAVSRVSAHEILSWLNNPKYIKASVLSATSIGPSEAFASPPGAVMIA